MVRAWYIDDDPFNIREAHHLLPPKFVSLEDLYLYTGVEYRQINVNNYENEIDNVMKEGGYLGDDKIVTEDCENLELVEHLHKNEEIRVVLKGSAYYDVRDREDEWIRIELVAGDLIVIPAGCYQRFLLDKKKNLEMRRIFVQESGYEAFSRPEGDQLNSRALYLKKLQEGAFKQRIPQ